MKELIDALHVIQNECKKHDGEDICLNCPLFDEKFSKCIVIAHTPERWKINDTIQRALL